MNTFEDTTISVTALTRFIQGVLEGSLPYLSVMGEISNYKPHSSGHRYFTLKDEQAQIKCVMWKSKQLNFQPKDGTKVVVTGRISVYAPQGTYQIDCNTITPAGIGDLYKAFLQLKQELQELGYFDDTNKKPLPRLPMRIGVSTSTTGAAIKDVISTIERRFPVATVVVRPTQVQGSGAEYDIANAIQELQAQQCDVIIVGRGGGSIEDLWAYNTRVVADAIYLCTVPVISAVGHETDFSISDFVADVRAATPTAAAELCTPIRLQDYLMWLDEYRNDITGLIQNKLDTIADAISNFTGEQRLLNITRTISTLQREVQWSAEFLNSTINAVLSTKRESLTLATVTLTHLHPYKPLQRGYALLAKNNAILKPSDAVTQGDSIEILRTTQKVTATVLHTEPTSLQL
ncbi:MAG: exodeoxyribonuclease VII large subunit [Bacteriodetes bacterium]|nr:exodeoxyribonuclease VII large subunit [Bacteroidota bacterium]